MSKRMKRLLFWAPRILTIFFALFLSIFALDVFGTGYSIGETILALLIHLIPTYIVLLVLAVAWRREWLGTVLFVLLALFYLLASDQHWSAYLLISGPLLLMAVLFLLNWVYRGQLRP